MHGQEPPQIRACLGYRLLPCGRGADAGRRDQQIMDWNEIERLRIDGFTLARRGYDRREVDKFLGALLDWLETDAPKDLGGMAVKRKFELAGKSTAQILLTTEHESEQMLRQTEEECADLRNQAEVASREVRRAADEHSAKVREKADEDARRTGE